MQTSALLLHLYYRSSFSVGISVCSASRAFLRRRTATPEGSGFGAQLTQAAKTGTRGLVDAVRALIVGAVMFWPVILLAAAGGGTVYSLT